MQTVTSTYTSLLRANADKEVSVVINGVRYLQNSITRLKTHRDIFTDTPTIGCCIAGEIDLSILAPSATIPRMATIKPYVRLTNGTTTSEWVQKGEYFIDTRSTTQNADGVPVLTIHGYDAMLKAEQDFIDSGTYPKNASTVSNKAASLMGVTVDSRTVLTGIMVPTLPVGFPAVRFCQTSPFNRAVTG